MPRSVSTAVTLPFYIPRIFRIASRRPGYVTTTRAFHEEKGEFTDLAPDGTLSTKVISIYVGDPGESYVMVPTEIGDALRAATSNSRPDRLHLTYFHDTKRFAAGQHLPSAAWCLAMADSDFARFLATQLPSPIHPSTPSSAVFCRYQSGNFVSLRLDASIAIDGTPDAEFAELASTMKLDIEKSLDELKDM